MTDRSPPSRGRPHRQPGRPWPGRMLRACDRGASAVEFALVAPALLLLVLGGVEFANAFFLRSRMAEVARDAARRVAVGSLEAEEAAGFARDRLAETSHARFAVTVAEIPTADGIGTDVTVSVSVRLAEVLSFAARGAGGSSVETGAETTPPSRSVPADPVRPHGDAATGSRPAAPVDSPTTDVASGPSMGVSATMLKER